MEGWCPLLSYVKRVKRRLSAVGAYEEQMRVTYSLRTAALRVADGEITAESFQVAVETL
jgi:hypothetical protein